jgi:hypothetical protein
VTYRQARALGYAIDIYREVLCGDPGWSFVVTHAGRVVIEGWTIGYGPRAKTQAMKDALAGIDAREALLACVARKEVA